MKRKKKKEKEAQKKEAWWAMEKKGWNQINGVPEEEEEGW